MLVLSFLLLSGAFGALITSSPEPTAVPMMVACEVASPLPEEWNKTFGEGIAYSTQQTSDGGYIIATNYAGLVKTDATGNEQWNRTFGVLYYNGYTSSIQQTSDGGYLIFIRGIITKIDAQGNTEWNKTASNPNGYSSIQQTIDGGSVTVGGCYYSGNTIGWLSNVGWLSKLDANGNLKWNKTFGPEREAGPAGSCAPGGGDTIINSVQQTLDGGYILAGRMRLSRADNTDDVWLIKTDANGNTQWNKTFGVLYYNEYASSVQQTLDGGYILSGYAESIPTFRNGGAWLIKIDATGNEQWNKTVVDAGGSRSDVFSSQQTIDKGYVITTDSGIIKMDAKGNIQWRTVDCHSGYSLTSFDSYKLYSLSGYIMSVQQTSDGGYIIAGSKSWSRPHASGTYAWLMKVPNESSWPTTQPTQTPTPVPVVTETPILTVTAIPIVTVTPVTTMTPVSTATSTFTPLPTVVTTPTEIPLQCQGCLYAESCIPFGTRMAGMNGTDSYCDAVKKALEPQKSDGAACQNSYECAGNYCSDGACGNLQKALSATRGLLEQILGFLRTFFGKFFPFPSSAAK